MRCPCYVRGHALVTTSSSFDLPFPTLHLISEAPDRVCPAAIGIRRQTGGQVLGRRDQAGVAPALVDDSSSGHDAFQTRRKAVPKG